MPEETEVPKTDLEIRQGDFIKEYGELVEKHKIDFASYPTFIPNGHGGFEIIVQNVPVDITNQPKKSPFVAKG